MERETIDKALGELTSYLEKRHGKGVEVFLFGSVARGDYDDESDIDVLVLLPGKVNTALKEEIYEEAYEIGLRYDVVFGIVIYELDFWHSELAAVMPLYKDIEMESIKL